MGIFLNSHVGAIEYQRQVNDQFFVDKSLLLPKLFSRFSTQQKYVCVTRPRRFGKTTNAQMMAAFFGKHPCPELFADLKIASHPDYKHHLNKHNVIFCTFSRRYKAASITQWLQIIETEIRNDLQQAYPDCDFPDYYSTSQLFTAVTVKHPGEKFIFIFDEWDAVFSFDFMKDEDDYRQYQNWLLTLFKDKPYVELAYLTGIRPLQDISTGYALNMFENFTLLNDNEFQEDFGFTQQEVEQLHKKYLTLQPNPRIDLPSLEYWYQGYDTTNGNKLYNPRSIVLSLSRNFLDSYWTATSSFDQIFSQIKDNIPAVIEDITNLLIGRSVRLDWFDFSAVTGQPETRNEILSALVTYGFVSIMSNKQMRIPNYELLLEFVNMIRKHSQLGWLEQTVSGSRQLVEHVKHQDVEQVARQIAQVHNWFSAQQSYNNSEAEFAAVIRLAFIGVTDDYDIKAEVEAGTGIADLVLLPTTDLAEDVIIIELNVDASAEQALAQIKSRKYEQIATNPFGAGKYTGRILGVRVSYNRKDPEKQHSCTIEILSPAQ